MIESGFIYEYINVVSYIGGMYTYHTNEVPPNQSDLRIATDHRDMYHLYDSRVPNRRWKILFGLRGRTYWGDKTTNQKMQRYLGPVYLHFVVVAAVHFSHFFWGD